MFLRVLFVTLLLGASIFVQVKETRTYFGEIQTYHYLLIATIYFLTFVYIILLRYRNRLVRLAYAQLVVDTALATAIIYATGGMESLFSFLYILTIINGSMILYKRGGLIIASISSILYGLLLSLHHYGVIHPFGGWMIPAEDLRNGYIFYIILANTIAFYLVAVLSSYLSEQARKSRVELRAKQDDIIKLEALNERIIRSIASGLITLDEETRIILFNPAAEEIFGISARDTIGKRVYEVLPSLEAPLGGELGSSNPEPRQPGSLVDFPYMRAGGDALFLRCAVSPLHLPKGEQKGKILVFQDVTEINRIEEEMKRVEGLALIGELAAGVAHEIRNPLASISGSIQMLKEGLEGDDVNQRLMGIIHREINRLNRLVSDFLRFARPTPPRIKTFDLNQLIADSIELFKNSAKWMGKVDVITYMHTPITIESDSEQLRQVLWNLFVNACEAMPDGGSLYVDTGMEAVDNRPNGVQEMAKVAIRDTGAGFSKKTLSHLFTPFFTTKEEGSGLGLAIVKRIVEGLKGEVRGENHPEGGAVITLHLPPFFLSGNADN